METQLILNEILEELENEIWQIVYIEDGQTDLHTAVDIIKKKLNEIER